MSHIEDGKLRFRSIETMEQMIAARFPHLEFRRDKRTQAWWGRFEGDSTPPPGRDPRDYGKCLHTIGRKGFAPRSGSGPGAEWEIGVVAALDGDGYDLLLDTFGGHGHVLAQELPALRREYAAAEGTKRIQEKLGRKFKVEREDLPGRRIKLKVRQR